MHHEGRHQGIRITLGARGRSRTAALAVLSGLLLPLTAVAGTSILPADQVLQGWTLRQGDRVYFRDPGGTLWDLVTRIDDPAIVNQGMGEFFPADPTAVGDALAALSYPIEGLDAEVFLLPFPRRALLRSSAEGGTIVLSPGVVPLSVSQTQQLVAHEMGHVVQHRWLPDRDREGWATYRRLRGIEDVSVYNENASHANRPHEIFAEDFRVLFGGPLAQTGGTENRDLAPPETVAGLREFFLALAGPGPRPWNERTLVGSPNPTPAGARFTFADPFAAVPGASLLTLAVYDVNGRKVADGRVGGESDMSWDGRTADGAPAPSGIYFVRAVRGAESWAGKILIAR